MVVVTSIDRNCLGHALHELNEFDVVYTARITYLKVKYMMRNRCTSTHRATSVSHEFELLRQIDLTFQG